MRLPLPCLAAPRLARSVAPRMLVLPPGGSLLAPWCASRRSTLRAGGCTTTSSSSSQRRRDYRCSACRSTGSAPKPSRAPPMSPAVR
eukprot:14799030-Alexandrium_andersonii.AAC.1